MKTKRTYLTVPGQDVKITIEGASGVGKTQVALRLVEMFHADGLLATESRVGMADVVTATCPTPAEARDLYLETLGEHEIATLRGHLDALGYEL